MSGTSSVLSRAAELVELGWCQGVSAEGPSGAEVGPLDPCAVRFCADGAIYRAASDLHGSGIPLAHASVAFEAYRSAADVLLAALRGRGVESDTVDWNDSPERKAGEVVALLKECAL